MAAAPTAAPSNKLIYLCIEDLYEIQIANKWAESKGRKPVPYLPLNRLTPDMTIIPIVRGKERTPMRYEESVDGRMRTREYKPQELISEVIECKPVKVGDYWSGSKDPIRIDEFTEMLGGELDRDAFFDAIMRSTVAHELFPRTHHGTGHNRMVLTWVI